MSAPEQKSRRWLRLAAPAVGIGLVVCAGCKRDGTGDARGTNESGAGGLAGLMAGGGAGRTTRGADCLQTGGAEEPGAGGATLAGSGGCGAIVEFPDPVVEAAVRTELGIPTGPLEAAAVASLEQLTVTGASSLQGLECATGLREYLYAEYGCISSLAAIAGLNALERVWLLDNRIIDMSPLANLLSLFSVDLTGNEVSELVPVGNPSNLREVDLTDNQLSTIGGSELPETTKCPKLTLAGNPLTSESLEVGIPLLCEKGWWVFADTEDDWTRTRGFCNGDKCYGE